MFAKLMRWLKGRAGDLPVTEVVVYSREGCHLCDEALDLLRKYEDAHRLRIEEVDIEDDPQLLAEYGDKVPVVKLGGKVRFFGKLNETFLRRLLRSEERYS